MYRATTPKHSFIFDVDPETAFKTILITYAQGKSIVMEKGKEDLVVQETIGCDGKTVYAASFTLSQEEANLFNANSVVKVQVRAVTYEGDAVASEKMTVHVQDVLNDEVLT